ncbi:hypothetical protein KZP23_02900 [Echinicola marina]|uniref:hypothetical protein n=1 Tax=Echinicola marina TaxID=2859768 RepID=UPI001CF6F92F|nr:hypothetical protein [Echinicola marina]UCS93996.1 hypothetical protein KZP23_02900 [Echinicola marina]
MTAWALPMEFKTVPGGAQGFGLLAGKHALEITGLLKMTYWLLWSPIVGSPV